MPAAILLVLAACRPDTVTLKYGFEAGQSVSYELEATAQASWQIEGGDSGSGGYRATFEVTETVESVDRTGALISVVMKPIEVQEEGLPSPGERIRTFKMRVGAHGEVVRVLELNGVPASDLAPDDIVFIGTFRPSLPTDPVAFSDRWQTRRRLETTSTLQQLTTIGRLSSLGRDADGRKAALDYSGRGPVVWTTELPQGRATLTGTAITRGDALVGIDDGALRAASSHVTGRFAIRIVADGAIRSPVAGSLRLTLDVEVRRLD